MHITSIILYKKQKVNIIVMFIYSSNETENRKEIRTEKINKSELQYKWLLFQRFFNRKPPARAGGPQSGPLAELLIRHFYDIEINKQYRFNEIELTDSIRRNFFNDFNFNNLSD